MSDSRPTIGVLANGYERAAGLLAGGQRHFIEVVKRWEDVDVVVFAPECAREELLATLPRARFVAMPSLECNGLPKALLFLLRALLGPLRYRALRRADALLATSHYLPDMLPAVVARRPLAVIVHHVYSLEELATVRHGPVATAGERISLFLMLRSADAICALSAHLAGYLQRLHARGRVVVTTNGIDHLALPADVSLDGGRHGAVLVARMHPAKGIADAVRAWRRVWDRLPGERLTIAGADEVPAYGREVRALCAQLGLQDAIEFAGALDDASKLRALLSAKLFLFPSYEEGWAIALAEAMRCGLPAVTYDLPVYAEVFPRGRFAAPLGDVEELAAQAIALLSDEPLRLRSAAQALELGRGLRWDVPARIEREALLACIGTRPGR